MTALLRVDHLDVHFHTDKGIARVVDDCNLEIGRREIVGVAGESGSGKTTLVEAILQIMRFPNRQVNGKVWFAPSDAAPIDLLTLDAKRMRSFRGRHIAYVPQGSMNSLNPVERIGEQLVEGMTAHGVAERTAKSRVPDLLERVGLESKVARLFPHELSGGMKQRVIIASATSMDPELIVADEPTTALDVNVQRRILDTLTRLRDEMGVSVLIVSHDLPVHAQLADRIGVMYAGQIVESGDIRSVLQHPLHPYADGLMRAIPSIRGEQQRIEGMKGSTPSPLAWPAGCRFHDRCPHRFEPCAETPPLLAELATGPRPGLDDLDDPVDVAPGRRVACHKYPESQSSEAAVALIAEPASGGGDGE